MSVHGNSSTNEHDDNLVDGTEEQKAARLIREQKILDLRDQSFVEKRRAYESAEADLKFVLNCLEQYTDLDKCAYEAYSEMAEKAYTKAKCMIDEIGQSASDAELAREQCNRLYVAIDIKIKRGYDALNINKRAKSNVQSTDTGPVNGNYMPMDFSRIRIKPFSKGPLEFATFKQVFKSLYHDDDRINPVLKFHRLLECLDGEARLLGCHLEASAENYHKVWNELEKRYSNPEIVINFHLGEIVNLPNLTKVNATNLGDFVSNLRKNMNALSSLSVNANNEHHLYTYLILNKLDVAMRTEFSNYKLHYCQQKAINFDVLLEFLESKLIVLQTSQSQNSQASKPEPPKVAKASSHVAGISNDKKFGKKQWPKKPDFMRCNYCGSEGHYCGQECSAFTTATPQQRLAKVAEKGLCILCFARHRLSDCKREKMCSHCGKKHSDYVHAAITQNEKGDKRPQNGNNKAENATNVQANNSSSNDTSNSSNTQVLTATFMARNQGISLPKVNESVSINSSLNANANEYRPVSATKQFETYLSRRKTNVVLGTVLAHIKNIQGEWVSAVCLLDTGSQIDIIESSFAKELGLNIDPFIITINGIGKNEIKSIGRTNVQIYSHDHSCHVQAECTVLDEVTTCQPENLIDVSDWPLDKMRLANPKFNIPSQVRLILGAKCYAEIVRADVVRLGPNLPILQHTSFGYVITGAYESQTECTSYVCTIGNVSKRDVQDQEISEQVRKFWEIESLSSDRALSKEEQEVEEDFVRNSSRDENGRFIVSLPLDSDKLQTVNLGEFNSSLELAYKSFISQETRLMQQPELYEQYIKFMRELLELDHAEVVNLNDPLTRVTKYDPVKNEFLSNARYVIPHLIVIKPSSTTTRLRVVFDASRRPRGKVGLNDCAQNGVVPQNDLLTILIKMRMHPFLLSADLVKMYRAIEVHENFRNLLHVLYRLHPNDPVMAMRMKRLPYGLKISGWIACRTLYELAMLHELEFPLASKIIKTSTYLDDILCVADSESELVETYTQMLGLLDKGVFEMHKFATNSEQLLKLLPRNKIESKLELMSDDKNSVKTLGLFWFPDGDSLRVSIPDDVAEVILTKMELLSSISKIYDPLGLLSPIVIQAKYFMQQAWRESVSWKDPLSIELRTRWHEFAKQLLHLRTSSLPRCVIPGGTSSNVHLYGYADASTTAFGFCIYIVVNGDSNLLLAKARVAPLKAVSLARLELMAMVLLTNGVEKVKGAYDMSDENIHLHTDSKIALAWIAKDCNAWTTFVCNRVAIIAMHTKLSQWAHISSKNNPADLLTRPIGVQDFVHIELWFKGPKSHMNLTSVTHKSNIAQFETELEAKSKKVLIINQYTKCFPFEKYSDLDKLVHVMSYVLRVQNRLTSRKQQNVSVECDKDSHNSTKSETVAQQQTVNTQHKSKNSIIKYPEYKHTLDIIIKLVQKEYFSELYDAVRGGSHVRDKQLAKLHPIIVNGILRVGGRIKHCKVIPFDHKHPVILPADSHVTYLLIKKEHERLLHTGPNHTLFSIRQKYWPISGRRIVKNIIKHCGKCRRFAAKPIMQFMGDLPEVRVTPALPFEKCGSDVTGPFNMKQNYVRKTTVVKWTQESENLKVGTIVLLKEDAAFGNPLTYPIARVVELYPGKDGKVRVVKIKTAAGYYVRPAHKLVPIDDF